MALISRLLPLDASGQVEDDEMFLAVWMCEARRT